MKAIFYLISLIIISFSFSSCKPSKSFVRTTDEYQNKILNNTKIGIISDLCLDYDPWFKKNYIIVDESVNAGKFMTEEAKKTLESKGYTVEYTFLPFTGAFILPEDSVRIAKTKGETVSKAIAPFYSDEIFQEDSLYATAVYEVLNAFYYTMTNNIEPPFSADPFLVNSLKLISEYTGQDKILFIIGNGTVVPLSKTIIQGVSIGLLTALITFGYFYYYIYETSVFDSYIGLLDLNTGELLWTNYMNLSGSQPDSESFYSDIWAKNMLYYFPAVNDTIRENKATYLNK
ncbi:MAG: hypothetical protein KA807_17870 [Prolixibacteraceae bacterium]|nr:hypothetical protein [Prolixibacteraceae bacterium]